MKKVLQIVFCILFFSCHKDKPSQPPIDFGYNYYPNEVGRYTIYQVDSIHYDDIANPNKPDTIRYLLKEVNALIFTDNSNRSTMRLERYYKYFKNGNYDSVWQGPRIW